LQSGPGRPRTPRRSDLLSLAVCLARARGQRYWLTRPKNRAKSEESAVARTEGVRRSDFPQKSRILQWFQWRKVFATFHTTSRNFPHEPNKINAESVREVAGSMCDKPPIPPAGGGRPPPPRARGGGGRIAPSPLARSGRSRPALRPWEGRRPNQGFMLAPGHSPPPRAAPCCCPERPSRHRPRREA